MAFRGSLIATGAGYFCFRSESAYRRIQPGVWVDALEHIHCGYSGTTAFRAMAGGSFPTILRKSKKRAGHLTGLVIFS